MKKSRIIALLTAVAMIMSVVPAFAGGYFVDQAGTVFEKNGENLVPNPGFEEGLKGLTQNDEYYEVSDEEAHSGTYSLKAIKSTKGEGALTAYFPVENPSDSYYLSFWYKNNDTVARRPRVTFAFTDSSKAVPTEENDFTDLTNAWIGAGTATNDCDMEYSKDNWVQYSNVITGTGSADACAYVVLNIYGLTKDVTYVDDFEVYALSYSKEYGKMMSDAMAEWNKKTIPSGPLSGIGTLNLPREVSTDGILVEWSSSSEAINAETGAYASGAEQELVILTARLYAEGMYDEVYFEYEYAYIVNSMFDPYVEWIKEEVFGKIGSSVDSDIYLPTKHAISGYDEAEITWSCSDENVLSPQGEFTAPETTDNIEITATIYCNGSSKSISTTVKALGGNLIPEGLIIYYDFEKPLSGSFLIDSSQNEKRYNAYVEGVQIVDGYAKFEGGKSTITLPSDYASELTRSYTVSMWVNLDKSIATSTGMYRFFDFGGNAYSSQFLRYVPSTGQLTFLDRGTAGGSEWAFDANLKDIADKWTYITLVYDFSESNAQTTVYVDGDQLSQSSGDYKKLTRSLADLVNESSASGYIGRTQWNDGGNPDYKGLMDDIRIYNRVLTSDEITTLYNETRPTLTAPVTIEFFDIDGKKLKDDVVVTADVGSTYDVPESYKSLPSTADDQYRYVYKYISSKSIDSVDVSSDSQNVCTLVFKLEKQAKSQNLIANGSFEVNLDGWTYNNNGTFGALQGWARSTEVVHEGNYSLKKTVTSNNGGASNNNIGTYIPIESGKKYTLSWWEHSSADKAAGNHQMMAAVVTSDNTSALGNTANRIVSCGGWDSWNSAAMGQATRDPAYTTGWTQRVFEFDTTNTPNAAYILIAYANGDATSVDYLDDFILEEVSENGSDIDDGETVQVYIKYVDTEGNTIKDTVELSVNSATNTYTVPDSYKVAEVNQLEDNTYIYQYVYREDLSSDKVSISVLNDNICTLVFEYAKGDKRANLVKDGSFSDAAGNFSWGTWQSPKTGIFFKDECSDWFYKVNRDTNEAALYTGSLAAKDYALGTRWNDDTTGLCSMANFIPVEKGKTYVISYDYKHKNPSIAKNIYISTSFVTSRSMSANAEGYNIPENVSTDWQKNIFAIRAPEDGYIYFHFSYLGESNNGGAGPFWYFDNFQVLETDTFENKMTYASGKVSIVAEDGTTGYLVQALYDADGALTSVKVSDMLTFNKETPVKVEVTKGAKLMLVKDLVSLEPLAKAIIAE